MKGDRKRRGKRAARGKQGALIGETIELETTDMGYGGRALGKYRSKAVFVPYTLPGEVITVEIIDDRASAAFARGIKLLAASEDRVAPACPHFGPGRCWGCQWQHIDYPAQLLLKQDVLADQLARIGKLSDSLIEAVLRPVLPAAQIWRYNQSMTLLRDRRGAWGYRKEAEGGIEAISDCHLVHPELIAALGELDLDYERARRLSLQRGSDGRIMLVFEIDAEEAPSLQTDLPVSVNLILPGKEPINLIGDAQSRFEIGDRVFRVTAGAAFRPNLAQVETLVSEVMRGLGLSGDERALELYAGVGLFSAFLAEQAALVTMVESYPPAANDAEANLSEFEHVDIVEGAAEAVLADMAAAQAKYDVALVDPPSSGLNRSLIADLSRLAVARLVYVSGDPRSLAHDCRTLFDAGFRLQEIQPVDMAPQTYYITAVARFER